MPIRPLSPAELAAWLQDDARSAPTVLDVREPGEVAICRLPGSTHIPMGEIPSRFGELDPDRPVVCVCHHGMRSLQVAMFLERQGLTELANLTGGIDAWSRERDPSVPLY